jgi:N-methylhydantoinase B
VRKCIESLSDGIEALVLGERTISRAHGAAGGDAGQLAQFIYRRASGEQVTLDAKSGPHKFSKGDRLEVTTAGGGGWGTKKSGKAKNGDAK